MTGDINETQYGGAIRGDVYTGAITETRHGGSLLGGVYFGMLKEILHAIVTTEGFQFDDGTFLQFDDNTLVEA